MFDLKMYRIKKLMNGLIFLLETRKTGTTKQILEAEQALQKLIKES